MSVADRCGLQDLEGAPMQAVRASWVRWATEQPRLRAVGDLAGLHEWTLSVSPREANEVLGVLAAMTDHVLMQHGAVDREPLALSGLHLVGHGHVGVKVGVAGTGVAVEEGSSDQPAGLDLSGAAGPFAGEDRMRLEEGEGDEDGSVVCLPDAPRDVVRRDGPQCRTDFAGLNVRSNPATEPDWNARPSAAPVMGSQPSPNRFFICSAVTTSPYSRPLMPPRPEPIQRPGASPFAA